MQSITICIFSLNPSEPYMFTWPHPSHHPLYPLYLPSLPSPSLSSCGFSFLQCETQTLESDDVEAVAPCPEACSMSGREKQSQKEQRKTGKVREKQRVKEKSGRTRSVCVRERETGSLQAQYQPFRSVHVLYFPQSLLLILPGAKGKRTSQLLSLYWRVI